jgi:hypothetical protein
MFKFRFNPVYMAIYYQWMYSVFLAVGPLLILIVSNIAIVFCVLKKCSAVTSLDDNIALVISKIY